MSKLPAPAHCSWETPISGNLPSNALRGGIDKNGSYMFVGRAVHEKDVLPAKVQQSQGFAYISYAGQEHMKYEYEVLRVDDKATVSWTTMREGNVPPKAVAVGTTDSNEPLFVGRVFHDGTLTIGKVQNSLGGCFISYHGQEISFPEYEVLVIKPLRVFGILRFCLEDLFSIFD